MSFVGEEVSLAPEKGEGRRTRRWEGGREGNAVEWWLAVVGDGEGGIT